MLWLFVLLFLSTTSMLECSFNGNNERQPYYYYRGRPMLLGASSSSNSLHRRVSSIVLPMYGNVYPRG